jgi:hypothetical protein
VKLLRDFWRLILIGIGLLVLLAACGGIKLGQLASQVVRPPAGDGASIAMSLHTVPTVRSVTVTPRKARFGNCSGGNTDANTLSRNKALGFPNGTCWVGKPGETGVLPVTVTNTGIAANIKVNGSDATPVDGGTPWQLCSTAKNAAIPCTGSKGKSPGLNQYLLRNFGLARAGLLSPGLTTSPTCDMAFGSSSNCLATAGLAMSEGIELVGPSASADISTHWHITITWTPVPD